MFFLFTFSEILLSGKEYVNSGETIRLVCNVTGKTEVPQDVDWFKNGKLLRSLVSKKVQIYKETSIAKRKLDSVLEIRDSTLDDSGTYVCRNSEELIADQKVIVLKEGMKFLEINELAKRNKKDTILVFFFVYDGILLPSRDTRIFFSPVEKLRKKCFEKIKIPSKT